MNAHLLRAARLGTFLLPLLGGCQSSYYVENLVGDWEGTATAGDQSLPMTASFDYDEEAKKNAFTGEVDIDNYLYDENGVTSDDESADIDLVPQDPNRGDGTLSKVMLNEEGDGLTGKFEINVCPPGTGQDAAVCVLSGNFDLSMK